MVVQDKPNYRDVNQNGSGTAERKQRLRERFEVVKKLGQGTYGKVQLAVNKETKQEVAIKTIKKAKIENDQDLVRIRREIQIMSSIHHPHIIHIYEVFENQDKIVLIMQYASGGELYDYLGCRKKLDENEARRVFRQVASAIFYCHKNRICHRDLKLENILLDDRGNAKIADFGLSNVFDERHKLKTFCGSPLYASPEIVRGTPYCGPEVDCWSLGVLLYTLVYGAMPFDGSNFKRLVRQISEGEYFEPKDKSGASGLIRRLLTVDIIRRATIRDICSDWWVNLGFDHPLLKIAGDMANLAPVRLDLLLALSSASSQPADQSLKKQIITDTTAVGSKNSHCNGYYTASHPIRTSEKSGIAKQNGRASNGAEQYGVHVIDHKKMQRPPDIVVKLVNPDKNDNDILNTVQDLIKDVVSCVEQQLNTNGTKATAIVEEKQCTALESGNALTVERTGKQSAAEELMETSSSLSGHKTVSIDSFVSDICNKNKFQELNSETKSKAIENIAQNSQTCNATSISNATVEKSSLSGGFTAVGVGKFPPPLPMAIESETNIPNKNCFLPKKKSIVKQMEPDIVIPIFNVCSNIPKRSIDLGRRPLNDSKSNSFALPVHISNQLEIKPTDGEITSKDKDDTLKKSSQNTDMWLNHPSKDVVSLGFESQAEEMNDKNINLNMDDGPCGNQNRKRILVKIPKQGKSNEQSTLINQPVLMENSKILSDEEKMKLEKQCDLLAEFIVSENSVPTSPDQTDVESSPQPPQRKSRRDSSKRSMSVVQTGKKKEFVKVSLNNISSSDSKTEAVETPNVHEVYSPKQESKELLKNDDESLEIQENQSNGDILSDNNAIGSSRPVRIQDYYKLTAVENGEESFDRNNKTICFSTGNVDQQDTCDSCSNYEANEQIYMQNYKIFDGTDSCSEFETHTSQPQQLRTQTKPQQRSLSRTRAMSMQFESLAEMSLKFMTLPKKPPGKVEIPKTFDPTQAVTSPKAEMKEILFIPTACVSESKEKIQKKIEKVKRSAIVIPPRRRSDAGVASRKKKYTRSKTEYIMRNEDFAVSTEDEDLIRDDEVSMSPETALHNEENIGLDNTNDEMVSDEMWYSVMSTESAFEGVERTSKTFAGQANNTESVEFCNGSGVSVSNNEQHRHSVDTESGYWTPPEMATSGEHQPNNHANGKFTKKGDIAEKIALQRAAFKNSKMPLKLSDEGLDMCSLSSSLESGISIWRHEERNGKMISPNGESSLKVLSALKLAETALDENYVQIARSFKKMTFPPEHSSASELSENCSEFGRAVNMDEASVSSENHCLRNSKCNGMKPIKPSDSQSSYGSNDISDDVFENGMEKEDMAYSPRVKNQSAEDKNSKRNAKAKSKSRNINSIISQISESWRSFSTDKESSDNDDDLDLMVDDSNQVVYGTEGLWQFLKSVNQHLSTHLKSASQKIHSKPTCHRSKSQESKHSDDMEQKRPVARSLSKEEKYRNIETQLKHFASEGRLANADSFDCFDDPYMRHDDTRYSSGYLASGSSFGEHSMIQKDLASSAGSFQNYSDISIYGTLRKDKNFQCSSSVSSPSMTRRRKSLQNPYGSEDLINMHDNSDNAFEEDLLKQEYIAEQKKKLSLYGTLRPQNLAQQGRTQSQILLSTDGGYNLLYNERSKIDPYSEVDHVGSGTAKSSVNKACSELNLSSKKESKLKDFEKLLLSGIDSDLIKRQLTSTEAHRNSTSSESSYRMTNSKPTSRTKAISDKGIRRVSFSNEVKVAKTDFHSSLRLNSLNKVREANEELSSSSHRGNVYEDEQDGGSLLEALKTYGYRGIMSQKLQSCPDRPDPRLNYRISADPFMSTVLNKTDWDNFEYMDETVGYQQPVYSYMDPMEYYQGNNFSSNKGFNIKRDINNCTDSAYDDDEMFTDSLHCYRPQQYDTVNRKKPVHTPQSSNEDLYVRGTRDAKITNSSCKKSDSSVPAFEAERRNSNPQTVQPELEEINEFGSTETKTVDHSIEVLSEKIQALKSRCQSQRKSLDEMKPRKELVDCGIIPQTLLKTTAVEAETLRHQPSSVDELDEGESSESVSDRIWRKSFYSRFNDLPTVRRKKSFLDTDNLYGYGSSKTSGKFSTDEEGGVEEPWLNTSLKRKNSKSNRSLSRQEMRRTSSLSSGTKEEDIDSLMRYYSRATAVSDTESKSYSCLKTERTSTGRNSKSREHCSKTSASCANYEQQMANIDALNKSESVVFPQQCAEKRTENTEPVSSFIKKNDSNNIYPTALTPERIENLESSMEVIGPLLNGTNEIPEIPDVRLKINSKAVDNPAPDSQNPSLEVLDSLLSRVQPNIAMEKLCSASNGTQLLSGTQDSGSVENRDRFETLKDCTTENNTKGACIL